MTKTNNVTKLTNPQENLLESTDAFLFDIDGVIWKGNTLIEGIPETLQKLRAANKTIIFVTNNSTKSRASIQQKFASLGLPDVPPEEIYSSSYAAAAYLDQKIIMTPTQTTTASTTFRESGKKVYVIGERGICDELDLLQIPWIGGLDHATKTAPMDEGSARMVSHDPDVGAVVVGFDRHINYYKMQYAQLCINTNPGCEFIATNMDSVAHLTDMQEWAAGGTMVGAIRGCTGKDPTVVGKPGALLIDAICAKLGLEDRRRMCMVGDRLDTDVLFGRDNGLKTVLVLSGVTKEEELMSEENDILPDFYADSINDFFLE